MTSNAPADLPYRAPKPSAETRRARPFDAWIPAPADPEMDAVDRVLGRAALDTAFRTLLLTDPRAALATEPMPLGLKRALIALRARSLPELAVRALEARHAASGRRAPLAAVPLPTGSYPDQAPLRLPHASVGS